MKHEILDLIDKYWKFDDSQISVSNWHDKQDLLEAVRKALRVHGVMGSPAQLEPVLAEIEHINDLGKSKWYEVVYFDEKWQSYAGSKTFDDGEKVIKWRYVNDCL